MLQFLPHWNNCPSCFTKYILIAFLILLYKFTESNCLCKHLVWFDSAFLSLFVPVRRVSMYAQKEIRVLPVVTFLHYLNWSTVHACLVVRKQMWVITFYWKETIVYISVSIVNFLVMLGTALWSFYRDNMFLHWSSIWRISSYLSFFTAVLSFVHNATCLSRPSSKIESDDICIYAH